MSLRLPPLRLCNLNGVLVVFASCMIRAKAFAQGVYGGCGIACGIAGASGITGISEATSLTELILTIISFILDFALLLAMLAVIVAGIYLITSNGDEGQKDKAKTIIFYVIIGILLIIFSRAIVILANRIFFAS